MSVGVGGRKNFGDYFKSKKNPTPSNKLGLDELSDASLKKISNHFDKIQSNPEKEDVLSLLMQVLVLCQQTVRFAEVTEHFVEFLSDGDKDRAEGLQSQINKAQSKLDDMYVKNLTQYSERDVVPMFNQVAKKSVALRNELAAETKLSHEEINALLSDTTTSPVPGTDDDDGTSLPLTPRVSGGKTGGGAPAGAVDGVNEVTLQTKVKGRALKSGVDTITVSIGDVSAIGAKIDNLGDIFEVANKHTFSREYEVGGSGQEPFEYLGTTIHRPNHNGTHGARSARLMIELLKDYDNSLVTSKVSLSKEQEFYLTLGAYFLRSGRVDESGGGKRDLGMGERSAEIYKAYAVQFTPKNQDIIDQVAKIMGVACAGFDKVSSGTEEDKLMYFLLTSSHEFDLARCKNYDGIHSKFGDKYEEKMKRYLGDGSFDYVDRYREFAENLLKATGERHTFNSNFEEKSNPGLFVQCSQSGGACWDAIIGAKPLGETTV
jgi:hypothetical protein